MITSLDVLPVDIINRTPNPSPNPNPNPTPLTCANNEMLYDNVCYLMNIEGCLNYEIIKDMNLSNIISCKDCSVEYVLYESTKI